MWPVATLWDRAGNAKASHSRYQMIPNNRVSSIMCSPLPTTPPREGNTQGRQLLGGNIRSLSPLSALFLLKVPASVGYTNPEMWRERNACTYTSAQQAGSMGPRLGRHTQQAGRRESPTPIIFHISPAGFGCCERDEGNV